MTAQIRYHSYNNRLAPGHENYWSDLENIARLIAYDLEGYSTCYHYANSKKILNFADKKNTIVVEQYKEKFGTIRVYWTPAADELVQYKYDNLPVAVKNTATVEDFRERCYVQDLIQYRNTYFMFKDLFPQYWGCMFDGADNKELLYETKNDYLNAIIKENSSNEEYNYLKEKKQEIFNILGWS